MPFVVSTLANSQEYTEFVPTEEVTGKMGRPAVVKRSVLIKGGAHVQGAIHTPEGVATKITEEEADFLNSIPAFKFHEKGGHVKIVNREPNADKVAADMIIDAGDVVHGQRVSGGSAQLSIENGDFEEGGRASGPAPVDQPTI